MANCKECEHRLVCVYNMKAYTHDEFLECCIGTRHRHIYHALEEAMASGCKHYMSALAAERDT